MSNAMSDPVVSVILPAYKGRYLEETIASILSQTFKDFELVVVDDASPDGIKTIVDQFSDKRIHYYRNPDNIGRHDLVLAWEMAMRYARAEWCVLASDDDRYEPDFLLEMLRLTEKYPFTNVFHCRAALVNSRGTVYSLGEGRMEYESCIQFMYSRVILRSQQTMPDFMFRISTWKQLGGFVKFPDAMHSDDATWIKMAQVGGVVCSSRRLFNWRNSGGNVSMRRDNVDRKVRAAMQFSKWLKKFVEKIECTTDEDRLAKKMYVDTADLRLAQEIRSDMRKATFKSWWKCVRTMRFDHKMLERLIYDRVIAIPVQLRMLLGSCVK